MSALLSECGRYRYTLQRQIPQPVRWVKHCLFIMLNPSTADAKKDDPTIRRCINFAKREGSTILTVANLFALRSTDPSILAMDHDSIGPDNDGHLEEQIYKHSSGIHMIVVAWGAHKMAFRRMEKVGPMLKSAYCLGTTKSGAPKHPLYVLNDQPLVEFDRKLYEAR